MLAVEVGELGGGHRHRARKLDPLSDEPIGRLRARRWLGAPGRVVVSRRAAAPHRGSRRRRRRRVARRRDRRRAPAGAVVRRLHDRVGQHDRHGARRAERRLLGRRAPGRPRPDHRAASAASCSPRPRPAGARALRGRPVPARLRRGARPRPGRRLRRLAARRARARRASRSCCSAPWRPTRCACRVRTVEEAGRVAGRLYAISTARLAGGHVPQRARCSSRWWARGGRSWPSRWRSRWWRSRPCGRRFVLAPVGVGAAARHPGRDASRPTGDAPRDLGARDRVPVRARRAGPRTASGASSSTRARRCTRSTARASG